MAESMLHEPPDAADLLATARAVLVGTLLPELPEALRFPALMVANAMAIAGRAAAADPEAEAALTEGLRALLDAADGDAETLMRRFARAIRAGAYDPDMPGRAAASAWLVALARHRAALSNPKALRDAGG